jgi:hypothetical protein
MAKKIVNSVDLEWIVLQEARKCADCPIGFVVAVVSDKGGWRIALQRQSLSRVKPGFLRKVFEIERRLKSEYAVSA